VTIVQQIAGAFLVALVLLDIFLTVLYARMGAGIIVNRAAKLLWRAFGVLAKAGGRHAPLVLSLCGPFILVAAVMIWVGLLVVGNGMIFEPHLGTGLRASNHAVPHDFMTALYAAGASLAVIGSSEFTPQTQAFRFLYLFNSLVGVSIVTLTMTYLMQIYTALQRRNELGLRLHLLTSRTGDAARLVAAIGPRGHFDAGYNVLAELSGAMTGVKESHHFYPVLFYFRFPEPYYSISSSTFVALDAASIIQSAVTGDNAWLKDSAAVLELRESSLFLVTVLEDTFLTSGPPGDPVPPDPATRERWAGRHRDAVRRLNEAGIATGPDENRYVELRTEWDSYVAALAPVLAYRQEEIDPVGLGRLPDPHPSR